MVSSKTTGMSPEEIRARADLCKRMAFSFETTTNCPRTPDRGADLLFVPSPVRRDRTDSQAIRLSWRRARRHSAAGRVERLHTGVDDA
jgi:hypothetical protein